MELFLWQHACQSKRKVMSETSRRWALFKRKAPLMFPWQSWNCLQCYPHAIGIVVNEQVKGKVLAKRINVHSEHIKHSESRDNFLKYMKENDEKKKRERCRAQPRRQPAPPRAARGESQWRGACAAGKPFPVHL